ARPAGAGDPSGPYADGRAGVGPGGVPTGRRRGPLWRGAARRARGSSGAPVGGDSRARGVSRRGPRRPRGRGGTPRCDVRTPVPARGGTMLWAPRRSTVMSSVGTRTRISPVGHKVLVAVFMANLLSGFVKRRA